MVDLIGHLVEGIGDVEPHLAAFVLLQLPQAHLVALVKHTSTGILQLASVGGRNRLLLLDGWCIFLIGETGERAVRIINVVPV